MLCPGPGGEGGRCCDLVQGGGVVSWSWGEGGVVTWLPTSPPPELDRQMPVKT